MARPKQKQEQAQEQEPKRRRNYLNFERITTREEALERAKLWYENEGDEPTITGLALYLGCRDKSELYVLKRNPEFADVIKTASLHVENFAERGLRSRYAIGSIFLLKNFDWHDSPAQQINIGIAANGLPHQINDAQQQALDTVRNQPAMLESNSMVGEEYFE